MKVNRSGGRLSNPTNPIFGNVNLPDPQRSGFDLSYNNRYTSHLFQLIPCFAEEVLPSDKMSYGVAQRIDFAPLVNPIFDGLESCYEAFFVPYRLVDPDWKGFITNKDQGVKVHPTVPLKVGPHGESVAVGAFATAYGSLLDYFGYGMPCVGIDAGVRYSGTASAMACSAYPILSYWRIIGDWYQNFSVENIAKDPDYAPMFLVENGYTGKWRNSQIGWTGRTLDAGSPNTSDEYCWKPFLRRYDRDFLSTATPNPQNGTAVSVSTSAGSFTIESFRMASALQRFAERENLAGTRYNEDIMAHFGVTPSDASCDRAEYLGSTRFRVDSNAVTQTSASTSTAYLGEKGGQLNSSGSSMLFGDRTFTEHGIVIVLQSVNVPPSYVGRRDRKLTKSDRFSWAFPELANLGDEPIYSADVKFTPLTARDSNEGYYSAQLTNVIGYQERYFDWKANTDEVHGEFANPNSDLFQYTCARDLTTRPTATTFANIGSFQSDGYSTYESRIFADTSTSPCRVSIHNVCHMSRALPEHATPMV